MYIIIVGFFLRILLATFEYLFQISTLYMPDSLQFHEEAIVFYNYLDNNSLEDLINYNWRIGWIYSALLGFLYYIFTPSLLLGTYISGIFWFLSAIILYKIFLELKTSQSTTNYYLFAYSFLFPTTIIYSSVILREPLILLLVNLIIFIIIKIKKNLKFYHLISFLIACSIFTVLHRANFIIITIFLMAIIYVYIIKKINLSFYASAIFLLSFFLVLYFNGIVEIIYQKIISYQKGHFGDYDFDRAAYYTKDELVNLSENFNLGSFLIMTTKNLYNYLLQPIFLNVSNFKDLILSYENLMRFSLLIIILFNIFFKFKNNFLSIICFLFFIINEMTYAQATINWGTASRHHVPIIGALLLCIYLSKNKKLP